MELNDLDKINREINGTKYEGDITNSGNKDTWFTPKEFYANGSGDCEDFAIAKYFKLRSLGYETKDMRISYANLYRGRKAVRDKDGLRTKEYTSAGKGSEAEAHMVLIVNGMVLDNMTNDVKSADEREDLDFVYQFNEDGVYVKDARIADYDRIDKWASLLDRITEEDMIDDYEDGGL